MQPASLIAVLASVVGFAQAGCYTDGDKWNGNEAAASGGARSGCDTTLAGDFAATQIKTLCVGIGENLRAEFVVQWKGTGSANLSPDDCWTGLDKEVGGCERGGESVTDNWFFKSDPNAGTC